MRWLATCSSTGGATSVRPAPGSDRGETHHDRRHRHGRQRPRAAPAGRRPLRRAGQPLPEHGAGPHPGSARRRQEPARPQLAAGEAGHHPARRLRRGGRSRGLRRAVRPGRVRIPRRRRPVTTTLQGVACAPGRAAGRAWVLPRAGAPPTPSPEGDLELAVRRVAEALHDPDGRHDAERAGIHSVQRALLADPEFIGRARLLVSEGLTARAAIHGAIRMAVDRLRASHDPLLAARCPDVRHLGERLLAALDRPPPGVARPDRPVILVARDLSAEELLALLGPASPPRPRLVRAVLLQRSGPLTHTAILARARGLPMVGGIPDLLQRVGSGDRLLVDGGHGRVTVDPDDGAVRRFMAEGCERTPGWSPDGRRGSASPRIQVRVNIDLPEEIRLARETGAAGVGLLRTDGILRQGHAPGRPQQAARYIDALRAWPGVPHVYRMFDAPAPGPEPALGPRGIRWLHLNRSRTLTQLDALLDAAAAVSDADLTILLPMVSHPQEVSEFRTLIHDRWQGAGPPPALGAMVETPAAAIVIDELFDSADLVAVGTNDLLSLLVGASREDPRVAGLLDTGHPALWDLLERVGAAARERGRTAMVCGALAADPDAIRRLATLGFDAVSVGLADVRRVQRAVWRRRG
ncbi:MAG: phosphoenolpyruvate--protein phosphotransferase [Deltaproteobacteria bacterium]|nr:MAG: phosphoenolpyruvate--protein phosphotransferase [Deltaproteobacteria bacterium]